MKDNQPRKSLKNRLQSPITIDLSQRRHRRLLLISIVAIGLLYRYGYFRQFLSSDGWQQERYEENDWYHMPVELVKDDELELYNSLLMNIIQDNVVKDKTQ